MPKTSKKTPKKVRLLKPDRSTEGILPTPAPTPALDILSIQAPLAYRNEVRALAVKQAIEDVITKLKSYQELGAAKDLNEFLEVQLRASLETIAQVVLKLNVPAAFFPVKAEIERKQRAEQREKEAMAIFERMSSTRK
jgi:hypothetical protein